MSKDGIPLAIIPSLGAQLAYADTMRIKNREKSIRDKRIAAEAKHKERYNFICKTLEKEIVKFAGTASTRTDTYPLEFILGDNTKPFCISDNWYIGALNERFKSKYIFIKSENFTWTVISTINMSQKELDKLYPPPLLSNEKHWCVIF